MRILSYDQATKIFAGDLGSFFSGVAWQYPDPLPSYFLPGDSGAKVGLSRIIANTLMQRGPVLLWVTETGIWPSSEHADLFLRYRRSYGEGRSVSEAPVHFFETAEDTDALISVLYITLGFIWGAEICRLDRSVAMTVSHDEWIEYRFAPGHEAFISEFQRWIAPCLRGPGQG
jgi:hypothetical protein